MTQKQLLQVKGLAGGYGRVQVLHGIDLSLARGEIVGVLGHNGMGKTTLLNTVMGFLPATRGTIDFDGIDLTGLAPYERARSGIGLVPQGRGILPRLSVKENLLFAYRDYGEETQDEMLDWVMSRFPRLERLLGREGGALSGGEQQLLALARSLMGSPALLLLDEPTEGIQPSIIEEIVSTLLDLRNTDGLSILLVEQNFDFIMDLADRVLVIERGRITADLPSSELQAAGRVEEFLGFGAARRTRAVPSTPSVPSWDDAAAAPPTSDRFRPADASVGVAVASPQNPVVREIYMSVHRPTLEKMREIVAGFGMSMSDREILDYMQVMEANFQAYDRIDAMPDFLPQVKYSRMPGYRPEASENRLNAWYHKCEVRGAAAGPLAGRKVVLKDNVCLAGIPMMNGASTLEGYTPDVDATVVTRILDAGGIIVGKAHCEYFCLSGGSHTNATGPVHNPYKMGYMAGGSSSGAGALVAAGEVEMAIGGDQGGSIRIPASFSGCCGMKPTHGLVPYTGIMPIEPTIDHAGPITMTVADNALLLEVIAGDDGLDPRQYAPKVDRYTAALGQGVAGLRIGVVREGFGRPESEPDVDAKVRQAADRLRDLGARVEDVSVPMHLDGPAIWTPIALEGLTDTMMHGNGFGTGWEGLYVTSLLDHHANWRSRADELSKTLKISMFVGEFMLRQYRGHFYAKAQNLSRKLRFAYDKALEAYDLLLMPTLPMKAQPIPEPDAPLSLYVQRAFEMVGNTAPFDASGHPAMSVPCGMSEGLPIGMMLVGKRYDESTVYRAAYAFEQSGDWRSM